MKLVLEIIEVENGYVIADALQTSSRNPYELRRWVAGSVKELALMIEKLANERRQADQKGNPCI